MPTFQTPTPVSVSLDLSCGTLNISAADRTDTDVTVRPSRETRDGDVWTAERTEVNYADGRLTVVAPKDRARAWFRKGASIDVTINVPRGSDLNIDADWATLFTDGHLGAVRIHSSYGDARMDSAEQIDLTGVGDVQIGDVRGSATISTGSGGIRIRSLAGPSTVKTASGNVWIGATRGDLQVNTASGSITLDRAEDDVQAYTAAGAISVGEAQHGAVRMETGSGRLSCGIANGTAAWIDAHTMHGRLQNELTETTGPQTTDKTVEVRARAAHGDIRISRSPAKRKAHR